jgi:hypothetical protein
MTRSRPIRGLFGGLFLGVCIDLDLVFGGVVKLQSALLTVLPAALVVLGFALGIWAPIGRRHLPAATPLPRPLPRPVTWPEYAPTEGSGSPAPAPSSPPDPDPPPTSSI